MIYVRDKGRMCNNILQYGHVYAWGRKNGKRTLSMRFAYKYPYFHICDTPGHNFFRYLIGKFGAKWGLLPIASYDEPGGDGMEQDRLLLETRNAVAQGWEVRHYDEFLEYFDEIKALFAFKPEVRDKVEGFVRNNELSGSSRLGMHIRRGDYARWHGGRYFYSDEQYLSAIKNLTEYLWQKKGKPVTVFICGNDPSLDEEKIKGALERWASDKGDKENKGLKVVFPKGNPGEDLCLLSECDMLAGPPSTFTLVASMYREIPLYRIEDPSKRIVDDDFGYFRELFRSII